MANRNDKFFQRLTRIFSSGPSVMRRVKGFDYRSYYDNDLIRGNYGYRAPFPFGRENSPFSTLGAYGILDRTARYSEFAEMETEPIIAAALNVWADEVAAGDEKGKALHLYSRNPEIKKNLEELFFDVLNVDFNLRSWARNLVKYGDFFLYLEVVPDIGVINVQPIPVNELEREEGFDPSDPYSVRFKWLTRGNRYLENWQVLHMRILGNDLLLPYGVSLLEPARRVYRQLCHKKGTKVWVKDVGQVNIEDVKPGQIVYSYDAQTNSVKETKVKHSIPMGIQPLVKVRTAHREIVVTPNHGLLVKDKNGVCTYKKASEIVVSNGLGGNHSRNADKLVLPNIQSGQDKVEYSIVKERYRVKLRAPLPGNGDGIMQTIRAAETGMSVKYIHSFLTGHKKVSYNVYEKLCKHVPNLSAVEVDLYLNHSKAKSIFFTKQNNSIVLDKEFVRFFGFMLGDGWVGKNGFGYAYGVDEEQNQRYDNIVNRLFGANGYRSRREGTKSAQINYSSQELANLFTDLGFVSGFSKKVIPSWCYGLNAELKRELILGLYDADGSYSNGTISLTNKRLIEDLKCLAHQAGYPVGRISKVKARNNSCAGRGFVSKESYRLWINTNRAASDTVFENVIDVTPVSSDETYDLEVDDELHNFTADGVVTHNTMMEDAMLVYRVERSPERRVFYIDVANIPPNDVPSFLEATKATLRSRDVVDKNTGRIDRRHNPLNMLEDFYIPVRGSQSGTKIETLAGATNATATEDVEYLQKKLFSAIQVPKAYLNYVENMGAKASLSQLDIRFSRTISVLQRIVLAELNKLAMIHLYSKGFDGEDLINFELKLSNPSTVALQQKLEVLSTKIDIAGKAKESGLVDQEWIQKKILELTQEEVARIEIGKRKDRIRDVELEAVAVAENLPDPNSKVDPFDSSNYTMPGQDVARNSATEPVDSNSDFDHVAPILAAQKQTFKNSDTLGKQKLGNDVESDNNYRVKDASGNYLPISASPFTYNSRRKTDRRVGAGGRDNVNMPDFKSMLSGTDKYTKDVFGSTDLNLKRSLFESMNVDDDITLDNEDQILERIFATPNRLPGEMKNIFANIDRKFGKRPGRSESLLLTEDSQASEPSLDIDLEIVDADSSLLEPASILSEVQISAKPQTVTENSEDIDVDVKRVTTLKDLLEDTDQ